jgi:hypothetical protein
MYPIRKNQVHSDQENMLARKQDPQNGNTDLENSYSTNYAPGMKMG